MLECDFFEKKSVPAGPCFRFEGWHFSGTMEIGITETLLILHNFD